MSLVDNIYLDHLKIHLDNFSLLRGTFSLSMLHVITGKIGPIGLTLLFVFICLMSFLFFYLSINTLFCVRYFVVYHFQSFVVSFIVYFLKEKAFYLMVKDKNTNIYIHISETLFTLTMWNAF